MFNRHSARIACPNGRQYHVQHSPCGEGRCGGSERSFTKGDGVNGCGAQASAKGWRPLMNRARRPIRSGDCVRAEETKLKSNRQARRHAEARRPAFLSTLVFLLYLYHLSSNAIPSPSTINPTPSIGIPFLCLPRAYNKLMM